MQSIALFIYDQEELPEKPLNYHLAARLAGFEAIIASWNFIEVTRDLIHLTECLAFNKNSEFIKAKNVTFIQGVVLHRTWGDSDSTLASILHADLKIKSSFNPFWSTICDKWNVELCFRSSEKLGNYIHRPKTYFINQKMQDRDLHKVSLKKVMLLKPSDGARTEGILISTPESFTSLVDKVHKDNKRYIAQEVLEKPFLYNGRRTDLRIYILVTSLEPLRMQVMKEGIARFAIATNSNETPENKLAIFTSGAFKYYNGFESNDLIISDFLLNLGFNPSAIKTFWDRIENLLQNVLESLIFNNTENFNKYLSKSYFLAGVDILLSEVDGKINPVFLEINNVPGIGDWSNSISQSLILHLCSLFKELK